MILPQKFKYPIGAKFNRYEIIDYVVTPRPNGKNRYQYLMKCNECGALYAREEYLVEKDLACSNCRKLMNYSQFEIGDIVNGLEILEKTPINVGRNNNTTKKKH